MISEYLIFSEGSADSKAVSRSSEYCKTGRRPKGRGR